MVKWNIGTYARLRPPRRGHDCAKFLLGAPGPVECVPKDDQLQY